MQCVLGLACEGFAGEPTVISLDTVRDWPWLFAQWVSELVCEGFAEEPTVISLDSVKDWPRWFVQCVSRLVFEGFAGETSVVSLDSGKDWTVGVGFSSGGSICSAVVDFNFSHSKHISLDSQSSSKAILRKYSGMTIAHSAANILLYFHLRFLLWGGISGWTAVHEHRTRVRIQD